MPALLGAPAGRLPPPDARPLPRIDATRYSAGSFVVALGALAIGFLAVLAGGAPVRPSSRDTAACIRDPGCRRTFVVAHRAEGFGSPENSRSAVAKAVEAGVPLIEIDVRASKDGELFVIHDGKLENSTPLTGRVETVAGSRIAAALMRNGESVPRFAEVYRIARGRAVLSVDFKADVIEEVADWIHAHGSFDDLIFFADTGEEMQSAASAKRRYPAMMAMVRLLDTRITVESTRSVFGRLPEIFHTDPLGAAGVAALHAQGVKVYMSALRPEQKYFQPFKYLAVRRLLQANPDFLLTGEPLSLMRRLGSAG